MTIFGQEGGASDYQLMMASLVSKLSSKIRTCDNLCKTSTSLIKQTKTLLFKTVAKLSWAVCTTVIT